MATAGVAWGVYSLRGRGSTNPIGDTAANFLRAAPLGIAVRGFLAAGLRIDGAGLALAVASGAIASGAGYAVWYAVLPHLPSVSAALVQLSVPVIAAAAGVVVLDEDVTVRLVVSSGITLGGIWLALANRPTDVRTLRN
jgi:drug/metabolite transporter (DMT)-like permease